MSITRRSFIRRCVGALVAVFDGGRALGVQAPPVSTGSHVLPVGLAIASHTPRLS